VNNPAFTGEVLADEDIGSHFAWTGMLLSGLCHDFRQHKGQTRAAA
jgi:hypothetical protein